MEELRVRCRYGSRWDGAEWVSDPAGCPASLLARQLETHAADCGFAFIACPFADCGALLRKREVDAHDVAAAQQHARGERAARLASAAALSELRSSSAAHQASASARFAALEGIVARSGENAAAALVASYEDGVPDEVDRDRKYALDAMIVSRMKIEMTMAHDVLVVLVRNQMRIFTPSVRMIKERIQDLIVREYPLRDENNHDVYHYIP